MAANGATSEETVLVDALPYIDQDYNDPHVRALVDKEIEDEMRSFKPKDYLAHLPCPELTFAGSQFLKAEFERVTAGKSMERMDTSRYQVKPPSGKNLEQWEASLDNAKAQLEHQRVRQVNLNLLQQYGADVWKVTNRRLEVAQNSLQKLQEHYKDEIEVVNRKRKADQVAVGDKLARLTHEYQTLIYNNYHVDIANARLEAEVEKLREEAKAKGLSVDDVEMTDTQ